MIYVCDAIMGSGKTSAAITYMNEHTEKRFIYIAPYLDETDRIQAACASRNFKAPSDKIAEYGFTKIGHSRKLLEDGQNVVTTHQAFSFYTKDILDLIREKEYTLIIDESLEALGMSQTSKNDLEILINSGCLKLNGDAYELGDYEYEGGKFKDEFRLLKSRSLIKNEDEDGVEGAFYWLLPRDLMSAFKDIFILTYLFESQEIYGFFVMNDMEYRKIGVRIDENGNHNFGDVGEYVPEYTKTLGSHIHICDHKKLNAIGNYRCALSKNWLSNKEHTAKLKNAILNYFQNIVKDKGMRDRMWTTYEDAQSALNGNGYKSKFIQFNARATNKYRNRTVLVFAVNVYMNTGKKIFFRKHGVNMNEDMYALSILVQWIWRSAIRDGKDIWIYVPSRRMREILTDWIQKVEKGELV
jgi:hypothetical protein